MLVNDTIVGSYSDDNGSLKFQSDFGKNYSAAVATTSTMTTYSARANDTLSSIANAVWGDKSLWYLLAEANALNPQAPIPEGLMLTIPARVIDSRVASDTHKLSSPSKLIGDTTPDMPMPQNQDNGCGTLGMIIMIAVAVAVTIYTAGVLSSGTFALGNAMQAGVSVLFQGGAATSAFGTFLGGGTFASGTIGAIAGAAGSIASQGVGMLTGNVKEV